MASSKVLPHFVTKIATTSNSCLLRQNAWAVVLQLRSLAPPPRPLVQHYTVVHTGAPPLHTATAWSCYSYIACSQLSNSLGREAPSLLLHHLKKEFVFLCTWFTAWKLNLFWTAVVNPRAHCAKADFVNQRIPGQGFKKQVEKGLSLVFLNWSGSGGTILRRECVLLVHWCSLR